MSINANFTSDISCPSHQLHLPMLRALFTTITLFHYTTARFWEYSGVQREIRPLYVRFQLCPRTAFEFPLPNPGVHPHTDASLLGLVWSPIPCDHAFVIALLLMLPKAILQNTPLLAFDGVLRRRSSEDDCSPTHLACPHPARLEACSARFFLRPEITKHSKLIISKGVSFLTKTFESCKTPLKCPSERDGSDLSTGPQQVTSYSLVKFGAQQVKTRYKSELPELVLWIAQILLIRPILMLITLNKLKICT